MITTIIVIIRIMMPSNNDDYIGYDNDKADYDHNYDNNDADN